MRWLGPVVLLGIAVTVVFNLPIGFKTLCEPEKNCLVAWISALSGWAALAGAMITVGVMREQLSEQRRQTDYMSGDMAPEMYLNGYTRANETADDDEFFSELEVTVVNRNRRALILRKLTLVEPSHIELGVRSFAINGHEAQKFFSEALKHDYVHATLPGKEDGQSAPTCVIRCHLYENGTLIEFDPRDPDIYQDRLVRVQLHCIQKDAVEKEITLDASSVMYF
ncbi:hypothetical protein [Agrobacterium tumefaciens]|nr:hypothetical protein [Agrobacterium tumefaciens]NTC64879.1 hypothetical protein [Agrobacterium tumefaciens]NTC76913.1 hypothetical protein [Agrobacterium tumefaciens]NTD03994.1 hypothetical protein [Agrobacterium tumefaciens]NTD70272.1 hypothetical protein [Agrobacterium tumefaciens]